MKALNNKKTLVYAACIVGVLGLTACSGNGGNTSSVTVEGDVPIAYVKRVNTVPMNPTDAGEFRSGGDLYVREKSSPSAIEYNITAQVTAGQGDVSRPEVSYDGKKIVFAMRCSVNTPCSGGNIPLGQQDLTWSIWEYDFNNTRLEQGVLRRVMSLENARRGDDYDPAYLAGGNGFVFTSRMQDKSSAKSQSGSGPRYPGQPGYIALDEYEREGVANLHTMNLDGTNIQQISFNQSHDRSPTVLQNGRIMYARWDHVGGRNHFSIFTVKPDGTDMFVFYGAHSAGNSRLHPREMQDGRVVTDQMPLSGTQEGGALMLLDVLNYSEQNTPANDNVPINGGQQQATNETLESGTRGISVNGRVTTPYPLWDGSNRVLVAYTPCQVTKNNVITACVALSDAERARLAQNRLQADINADNIQNNVPVAYSIQMFDIDTQSWRTVVPAVSGFMYKDPVALMARPEPNVLPVASATTPGPQAEVGTLSVRSVYDTDSLGRMGNAVLSPSELSNNVIPRVGDTANIAALKDPANPAYKNRPARFVRITRAVATPAGSTGMREAIGETEFEMQQIVGYADVEPDGSIRIDVPADIPLTLSVTDAQGRAFQSHTNWLQIRPGEERTCNGCHSPRRGAALNSGALLDNPVSHPNTALAARIGETMADTRARNTTEARRLKLDIDYTDVWATTPQAATPCTSLRYTGNKLCDGTLDRANDLATRVPVNGIINYPDHIQPLWERGRPAGSCVSCHSDPVKLDLRSDITGTGRYTSYQELLVGDPVIENGIPQTRIANGALVVELGAARVNNTASQGDAIGLARKSRLMEILSGETLMASAEARSLFADPATAVPAPPNHATMLNAAEKRLLAEWIDLGAQYYNDPFNSNGTVRLLNSLSRADFDRPTASNGQKSIHSILLASCGGCHQAGGSDASMPAPTFENNRFVLTGSSEGDYNVSLSMVNDTCTPMNSYLLSKPSTNPHPSTLAPPLPATAVLPSTSSDYVRIYNWIGAGCASPLPPLPIPTP